MRGYKATDKDMSCRGYQYELDTTYHHDGHVGLCESGFHFCRSLKDCFGYYDRDTSRVFEIEATGKIIVGEDKCVCEDIRFIRELGLIDINRLVYGYGDGNGYGINKVLNFKEE